MSKKHKKQNKIQPVEDGTIKPSIVDTLVPAAEISVPVANPAIVVEQPPQPGMFHLKVEINQLRRKSIFLAVPMYGGQCSGIFSRSVMDLSSICTRHGIGLQAYFLFNESLITRARNYCADEFMRSQCTHLMFIDADIGFNPNDVIALLAMQSRSVNDVSDDGMGKDDKGNIVKVVEPFIEVGTPYDVIGAPYPKKCISWEKIKLAVDRGAADKNPNNLENFVGDFVFNPKTGNGQIPIGMPAEVSELGTGFMMIRRETFAKFKTAYEGKKSYKPDHVRTEHFDGRREIMMYFQAEIDFGTSHYNDVSAQYDKAPGTLWEHIIDEKASKRYLSEDYQFCYDLQKIGLKTWLCPWMMLSHVGTYVFAGSLLALAQIGAAATADPSQLNKGK